MKQNTTKQESAAAETPPARTYIHTGEAWYASVSLTFGYADEVMFYVGNPLDNGTEAEMAMRWYDLGEHVRRPRITPRLEVFGDSWWLLMQQTDLLAALGEATASMIQPLPFCELLATLGFLDVTVREKP